MNHLHQIKNRSKRLPPLRVGIGGPVGSGKTTLLEMLCKAMRDQYDLVAITNDIYTKEDQRLFPPKRIPWMGWTINFANWKSILAFLLVLGSILLLILIGEALNFLPK